MKKLLTLAFGILIAFATTASPPQKEASEKVAHIIEPCSFITEAPIQHQLTVSICIDQVSVTDAIYPIFILEAKKLADSYSEMDSGGGYIQGSISDFAEGYHDNWPGVNKKLILAVGYRQSGFQYIKAPPLIG